MPAYTITPQDVLMFRDGRPMEGGLSGHGARWPDPSIIFDALHAALHRAFPAQSPEAFQPWEHLHRYGRSSDRDFNRKPTPRFGSLATLGPFPVHDGRWLFPCPADVTQREQTAPTLHPLRDNRGQSNLPAPLHYPLGSRAEPNKEGAEPWWNKAAIEEYLGWQKRVGRPERFAHKDLYAGEWATGIAIDPATQTTGQGEAAGKIYSAEYLRLRDNVALGIHATLPMKNGKPDGSIEGIRELFPAHKTIIVGGQQRTCQAEPLDGGLQDFLPLSAPVSGDRVRWTLLSPAVFPRIESTPQGISEHCGGWLPNWVSPMDGYRVRQGNREVEVEKGRVLLKRGIPRNGQSRDDWRKAVRQSVFLDCHLVAACVPKPIVLTGWSERMHLLEHEKGSDGAGLKHGPRPTLLAVPASAVYYFEGKDAPLLADALAWHGSERTDIQRVQNRRSTLMGEKGFGLGVCGTWDFYENVAGRPGQ